MSDEWYFLKMQLPGNRAAWVVPLTYGRARIGVGPDDSQCFDDLW